MNTAADIDCEASRWLASQDARAASPEERAEFERWLESDIRHRVAYLRLKAGWHRAESLSNLRPLDSRIDADLLRSPGGRWHPVPWAIAAAVLFVTCAISLWVMHGTLGWQTYETRIGSFSRIVLDDGSVVDLNTNSEIRVHLVDARREIRLIRGEGRFNVAHDASRPFEVSAGGTAVRAIGTAFTVRLRESDQVDVLVTQGKVAIDPPNKTESPALLPGDLAHVNKNQVSVQRLPEASVQRHLAWTSGQLQFRGETLREAAGEFNRYNRRKIVLADASIAGLRVGGNFNATDPDSFAAAVEAAFSLNVAADGTDAIVLGPP